MTKFNFQKLSMSVGALSIALGAIAISSQSAGATTFTRTSPTSGGSLDAGISEVGGIVLDLIGANGARVTSQLAASTLFTGFAGTNPFEIGTQTGFNASVLSALGGGIQEAGIRFTLFDGDTATFDFDEDDNTLLLNGVAFGNWTDVNAQATDSMGVAIASGFSNGGFRNNTLDTGWFFSNNATTLSNFYNTLVATGEVVYEVDDVDPGDNFYDFTQGIDSSLINVGKPPTVTPPTSVSTPEPASLLGLLAVGAFGANAATKRKKAVS
jgi:hypothetical protein